MSGPAWLSWPFAVLMIASATFYAVRLAAAGKAHRRHPYDLDLTHLAMSIAMAAMLVLPFGAGQATLWLFLVAVPAAWFGVRTLGPALAGVPALGRSAEHLVMVAAMLYMLALAAGPMAHSAAATDAAREHMTAMHMAGMHMAGMDMAGMDMAGMDMAGMDMAGMDMAGMDMEHGAAASPAVSVGSLTLVALLALVSVGVAREVGAGSGAGGSRGGTRSRGASVGCRLAMTSAMGYMLVLTAG